MSTRTKLVISIIGICLIIAVVAVSIVLAFTAPAHNIESSSLIIKYTPTKVVANVRVSRQDINLYSTGSGDSGVMESVVDKCDYNIDALSTSGESGRFNLGAFNEGQFIDMAKADTTLLINIALDKNSTSGSPIVKLAYSDKYEADYNIKFVISGKIYSDNAGYTTITIPETVYNINGDNFSNIKLFEASTALSTTGYNKLQLTCTAKIVSYTETSAKLDGDFVLSLNV